MSAPYAARTLVGPENIPEELRAADQWIVWQYVPGAVPWRFSGEGKPSKIPVHPLGMYKIPWKETSNWMSFEEALQAYEANTLLNGIGIVLTPELNLIGGDLDHALDHSTGQIAPWADAHIRDFSTYTEVSVGAEGFRCFLQGQLPQNAPKSQGDREIYSSGRFLTITGNVWRDDPIRANDAALERYLEAMRAVRGELVATHSTSSGGSNENLFSSLMAGDNLHDSTRDLAYRLIDDGMKPGKVVEFIRSAMKAMPEKGDMTRWQERYDDIPRLVNDAARKLEPKKEISRPLIDNAENLMSREFSEVEWAIKGIIPEGITILSGDPKIGKSWLLYQSCIAIASGQPLWAGREPETQGDALMLALEDNDRRLQRRLQVLRPRFVKVNGKKFEYPTLTNLHYATQWGRAEDGVTQLRSWLDATPKARLIVIDTVSAFRQRDLARNKSAYAADYEVGEMFKPLARDYKCAIVLVMHNRKQHSEDALQLVSGTQGMTGGVDNVLILQRKRGNLDAGLYVDGRDIEDPQELALKFDGGYWTSDGQSVEQAQMGKERREVIAAVISLGPDAKVRAIADELKPKKYSSVRSLLSKMLKAGDLTLEGGVYSHTREQ